MLFIIVNLKQELYFQARLRGQHMEDIYSKVSLYIYKNKHIYLKKTKTKKTIHCLIDIDEEKTFNGMRI